MEKEAQNNITKITKTSCILFLFAGIFYLYEFFVRTSMGTIEPFVRSSINVNAQDIATISSAFSVGYVVMQIPVGIIFDKFKLKTCGFFAIITVALGCLIFSLSSGVFSASLGRFIMGVGAAFALLMMLKISVTYFPPKIAGGMTGLTSVFGIIGPVLAGGPLAYYLVVTENNWTLLFKLLAILGMVFAITFYFVSNSTKQEKKTNSLPPLNIKQALKQKNIWGIAVFGFFIYPSIELFGSLYGSNHLSSIGYKYTTSTTIVSFVWLGMGLSTPIIGFISDYFRNRKIILCGAAVVGVASSIMILFGPDYGAAHYMILYFLLGSAAGTQAIVFAVVADTVPRKHLGISMALVNMSIILGVVFIQMTSGTILHNMVDNQDTNPTSFFYSVFDYQVALLLSPIFFGAAFITGVIFIKNKKQGI
ncbi:hypothetical protein LO80_07070 [Candidatus Francisella endociliophora]|uniref:Lysosomal dipeptide transporter MFSD1 n=1 Tax=Candidatus Francisella endociliophora TaxID=653937 RepID=A0A097EQ98_9GAMM|nr:MFS transporter [Francisella sp. FSC1006]AIT09749.1 hypothetical protein LO80_07070 [Francisella sp. FSC1006]